MERAFIEDRLATQIVGAPDTVQRGIADLVDAAEADELMITTMVYDPADRLRLPRAGRRPGPRVERGPRVPLSRDYPAAAMIDLAYQAGFRAIVLALGTEPEPSRGRCKSMPGSGWVIARGLHVAGPCQHSLIPPAVSPGGRSGGRDGRWKAREPSGS